MRHRISLRSAARARIVRLATVAVSIVAFGGTCVAGCTLGNISQDDCTLDVECRELFGLGSICTDGFCSDAVQCDTNFDCRSAIGPGAICDGGSCVAAPLDPRCVRSEPPDLIEMLPGSLGDRIVFGAIFKVNSSKEDARAVAVEMAISELNRANGIQGREFGIIICNNDSNGTTDDDAAETTEVARYLAEDLGVPAIIGPSSSSNALAAGSLMVEQGLDTVVISPSATGISLSDAFGNDPYRKFWRTCPSDRFQALRMSELIKSNPLLADIGMIFQNDNYGSPFRAEFREVFEDGVNTSVTAYTLNIDNAAAEEANIQSLVSEAALAGHDAILVVSGDAVRTVKILGAAKDTALAGLPFFLTDGSKDADVLLNTGDPAINAIVQNAQGTAAFNPTTGAFVEDFNAFASQAQMKMFDAGDFSFLAHAYDATYVAAFGAAYASADKQAFSGADLVNGMTMLSDGLAIDVGEADFPQAVVRLRQERVGIDIEGASGPLDFDATLGEAPGVIEVWQVNATFNGFANDQE